jgi:hypothetical protein
MRLHEIADAPDAYLLTDFQIENVIDELVRSVGNIRLSAAGCSRHQPAMLRDRTRGARPAALPAARPEASHFLGLPDCPTYYQIERPLLLPVKAGDWGSSRPRVLRHLAPNWSGRSGKSGS